MCQASRQHCTEIVAFIQCFWDWRVQHVFRVNRVSLNLGLGGVRDVAFAIISHEQIQLNRVCFSFKCWMLYFLMISLQISFLFFLFFLFFILFYFFFVCVEFDCVGSWSKCAFQDASLQERPFCYKRTCWYGYTSKFWLTMLTSMMKKIWVEILFTGPLV